MWSNFASGRVVGGWVGGPTTTRKYMTNKRLVRVAIAFECLTFVEIKQCKLLVCSTSQQSQKEANFVPMFEESNLESQSLWLCVPWQTNSEYKYVTQLVFTPKTLCVIHSCSFWFWRQSDSRSCPFLWSISIMVTLVVSGSDHFSSRVKYKFQVIA